MTPHSFICAHNPSDTLPSSMLPLFCEPNTGRAPATCLLSLSDTQTPPSRTPSTLPPPTTPNTP
ncbi:hypothetical protein Hdeb2414_s0002g00065721 [Helianthus debilis subsp. tardiflorus]